jgi:hypothetical protein
MKTLEHVLSLQDPLFELLSSLANVIEDQFYQRWKMLTTNLPYVKAFLNPYLLGETRLHDNANTKKMLNKVLQKITNTSIAYAQALKEFTNFVKSQCLFLTPPKQMTSTCSHISVRI